MSKKMSKKELQRKYDALDERVQAEDDGNNSYLMGYPISANPYGHRKQGSFVFAPNRNKKPADFDPRRERKARYWEDGWLREYHEMGYEWLTQQASYLTYLRTNDQEFDNSNNDYLSKQLIATRKKLAKAKKQLAGKRKTGRAKS